MIKVNRRKSTEAFAILRIKSKRVKVNLDTGAEINVMTLQVLKQMVAPR